MHFLNKPFFTFVSILIVALALSACQKPASQPDNAKTAATKEVVQQNGAQPTVLPSPSTDDGAVEITPKPDTGFQEVTEPLDKIIFPPEVSPSYSPAARPKSTLGQDDATLTLYEWCDYAYPNCSEYNANILPELKEKYVDQGKLRIVHKEFPVAGGDPSVVASMGAQCAAQQGKFSEMANWLYQNTTAWSQQSDVDAMKEAVKQGADTIGLDMATFNACIDNEEPLEDIKQDYFDGSDLEFKELPAFVVGGHVLSEGVSGNELMTIIDALLQREETGSLPDTVITVTPSPTPDTDFEEESVTAMGSPDASITIVEFSDYQCPYCLKHFEQTMPQLKKDYIDTGRVRYVFKDFPLSFHEKAKPASLAAECAGEQGKYWEMHDKLFGEQERWVKSNTPTDVFKDFAKELKLDVKQFDKCLDSEKYMDEITADMREGIDAGVQGTPAFFINGQFLSGAQPYQVFKQIIDQMLADTQ